MLIIEIDNIERIEGQVLIGLFKGSKGFPEDRKSMIDSRVVKVEGNQLSIQFSDLEPGDYAFSVVQDYNENYEMDKSLFGLPQEPYAFSNNFTPRFSAPEFEDCNFLIKPGKNQQTIQLIH